jgi:hypothetical protein
MVNTNMEPDLSNLEVAEPGAEAPEAGGVTPPTAGPVTPPGGAV